MRAVQAVAVVRGEARRRGPWWGVHGCPRWWWRPGLPERWCLGQLACSSARRIPTPGRVVRWWSGPRRGFSGTGRAPLRARRPSTSAGRTARPVRPQLHLDPDPDRFPASTASVSHNPGTPRRGAISSGRLQSWLRSSTPCWRWFGNGCHPPAGCLVSPPGAGPPPQGRAHRCGDHDLLTVSGPCTRTHTLAHQRYWGTGTARSGNSPSGCWPAPTGGSESDGERHRQPDADGESCSSTNMSTGRPFRDPVGSVVHLVVNDAPRLPSAP